MDSPVAESEELPPRDLRSRIGGGGWSLLLAALVIQVAQVAVHILLKRAAFYSDILQGVASAISTAVCFHQAYKDRHNRHLWLKLGLAFFIWSVAQTNFAFVALTPGVTDSKLSEFLWLIYAFPLLLVTSYTPRSSQRDTAGWLDGTQALLFFSILCALYFPLPGIISQAISDDIQAVALFLVLVLRFCAADPGRDRAFFRHLTLYMAVYLVCCAGYYSATTHGFAVGSGVELCWSVPFTFFSVTSLCTDLSGSREGVSARWADTRVGYVQGASALGLALMSMAAAAVLSHHKPVLGYAALAVAFLLFAARTSAREWQLQSVHSRLQHTVLHDPLTAVANRAMLEAEITLRLERSSSGSPGYTAVLFVGLDRFKTLNDCLGHAFGDLLLQRVANLLSYGMRKHDLVARYGGDEFVLLIQAVDKQEAEIFANRILASLRNPLSLDGRILYLTASIGFALGGTGGTASAMLQEAHFAMYHAKKAGKDRARGFEPEMVKAPQYKLSLEADLREALAKDQIDVHFQPIFSIEAGSLQGFEALARWNHPKRGNVSPADFIEVAEDTGLIIELGYHVLFKSCRQAREWNRQFSAAWTMNVNVSAHQFASPNFLEQIKTALSKTGLDPTLLKLEITESVLLSGYSNVKEILLEAQKLGIQICLDDFGTGYSSLSYLLNYPFDVVKIDQSFIRNLDEDPRRVDVVRSLIQLAVGLGKHLVAEGVERLEELDCLRDLGCELAQGYLLAKPLSVKDGTTLLQTYTQLRNSQPPAKIPPSRQSEVLDIERSSKVRAIS